MPGLKRFFSSLSLRKQSEDQQAPRVQKESLLKRSGAVLRKKSQPVVLDDGQLDDIYERPFEDDDAQCPVYRRRNHAVPWPESVLDFDIEMEAIADMRARRRYAFVPELAARQANFDEDFLVSERIARHRQHLQRAMSGQQRANVAVNQLLNVHDLHAVPPLPANIAVASRREVSRVALGPIQPSEDPFEDAARSRRSWSSPPAQLGGRSPTQPGFADILGRREAWVHRKRGRVRGAGNVSEHVENAELCHSAANADANNSFAMHQDHIFAAASSTNAKIKKAHSSASGERYSGVEEWLSATSRMQSEDTEALEEQLTLMLKAQNMSDEELARALQASNPDALGRRDCIVCGDTKTILGYPAKTPTTECEHESQTCIECLQSWMSSEIESKGTEGIKCPECPQTLTYQEIQRAASPASFATYDKLATRAALGGLKDFAWCLSPSCGSGQENSENSNYMECHACKYKQCISHRTAWHIGETCEQYDYRTSGQKAKDDERKTEAMLDTVSRKCPNATCGWRIQKIDGCDHMTCRRCRFEFCWLCCASQKEIRRIGNTAHKESCKYHSKNLDVAWPFNAH